ncbi:uncharacterized protein LOC141651359 [Silene latifolia]|uniref:uncharacterized protein LOC141651359 n=1 Tax=Silene latifolia TaxID=37657 RepID=UPI003D777DFC
MVCMDEGGGVLWGGAVVREQYWEPYFAEAVAVLDGLQAARNRGHQQVVVKSDCLQVIDTPKERRQGRSIFSQIIDDIFELCTEFFSVLWSHASRVNNCVAHALAQITPRVVGSSFWLDVLPPNLQSLTVL